MTRRWLITGASGAIGSVLANDVAAAGDTVVAVTRPAGSPLPPWLDVGPIRKVLADLTDPAAVDTIVADAAPDVIAHLAIDRDPSTAGTTNPAMATALAAAAARHGARLLNAGSSFEHRAAGAAGPYGDSKAAAASAIRTSQQTLDADLEAVNLRIFHAYGPGEPAKRLIPQAIRAAVAGTPMRLTEAGPTHDFVHVDDVAAAFIAAAETDLAPGRLLEFDVCTGVATTNEAVIAAVETAMETTIRRHPATFTARPWDQPGWSGDPTLLTSLLGRPPISLDVGLRRLVNPPLAIVVPHFRTAATAGELHDRASTAARAVADPARTAFVYVDDACDQGSGTTIDEIEAADPRVVAIHSPRNEGQASAIVRGLAATHADVVVVLDGDLQDPPEAIPHLVDALADPPPGVDAVFAGRRGAYEGGGRLITGHAFKWLMSRIAGTPPDAGGYVALRGSLAREICRTRLDPPYLLGAIAESRRPTRSIPVTRERRPTGPSATGSVARLRLATSGLRAAWRARRAPTNLEPTR